MKCEHGSNIIPQQSLIQVLVTRVSLLMCLVVLVGCSEDNASPSSSKINSSKNTQVATKLAFTQHIQARRAKADALVNLAYVDQSRMVSNSKEFGVQVLAVTRTAAGYMLDFRFMISDKNKAQEIMQRKIKAQLIIEKNNGKLVVPVTYKLGALRQSGSSLKENKTYFMMFANPSGMVKAGDLVTFSLGGFKAEHITVN